MIIDQGLIKVNTGLLSALSTGSLTFNVFARDILVLECIAAGTSFRSLDQVQDELKETVQLEMKREGKNEFDQYAVALWFQQTKIGYIPKDRNEVVARLMDAGKQFYATICTNEKQGKWLRLKLKVLLRD